jgi:hypothetical protein
MRTIKIELPDNITNEEYARYINAVWFVAASWSVDKMTVREDGKSGDEIAQWILDQQDWWDTRPKSLRQVAKES